MDTRGWMGGVSRRAILSIKPETFFRAVFETSLKSPRSLACKCVQVYIPLEGLSRRKYRTTKGLSLHQDQSLRQPRSEEFCMFFEPGSQLLCAHLVNRDLQR